jgi:hypothetical protein
MRETIRITVKYLGAIALFMGLCSFAYSPAAPGSPTPPAMLSLIEQGLDDEALLTALEGYSIHQRSDVDTKDRLIIIDYTKSSNTERLYVLDMRDTTLVHQSLVAHGRNSGNEFATSFSNKVGSYQSSLGFFRTAETYSGKHGLSLRLDGLENGINHKARERAIVIHKADYVSLDFAAEHGRIGRSLGCPALPEGEYAQVIDLIKEGCLLYIHGADAQYAHRSVFLAQS